MKCTTHCIFCFLKKQEQSLLSLDIPEPVKHKYIRAVLQILSAYSDSESAPRIMARINGLRSEILGVDDSMAAEKLFFNDLMMQKEDLFRQQIDMSDDPLRTALQLSRTGNYIDFSAVDNVSDEQLLDLLEKSKDSHLDEKTLQIFRDELAASKNLVFCTDNCGEVVLDKLLIEVLRKYYPHLQITVLVKGQPVLNDATMKDAVQIGLTDLVTVIGNGSAVPGTDISTLSAEAKELLLSADMIISKGQGNFETLSGCGLNVYYLFLCKCDMFVEMFGLKRFEGVFTREKDLFPENNT